MIMATITMMRDTNVPANPYSPMLMAEILSERLARRREINNGRNPMIPATIPAAIAASMLSFPSVAGLFGP